jgi:hypothetical protein
LQNKYVSLHARYNPSVHCRLRFADLIVSIWSSLFTFSLFYANDAHERIFHIFS